MVYFKYQILISQYKKIKIDYFILILLTKSKKLLLTPHKKI